MSDEQGPRGQPDQLPLFEGGTGRPHRPGGITAEVGRASVSPGWWPVVGPLWTDGDAIVVTECREVDGVLRLALSSFVDLDGELARDPRTEDGRGATLQEGLDLSSLADRLVLLCGQTCACCGQRPARLRKVDPFGAVYVLCECCFDQINGGTSLLAAADAYWRLDGARRPRALNAGALASPLPGPIGSSEGPGAMRSTPSPGANSRPSARKTFTPLPSGELRELIGGLRSAMAREILGQDEAVARLALAGALHVGGGLTHGQRTLIVGSSGVGKSSLARALCQSLADAGFDLPLVTVDAVELTSPGWSGAVSVNELLGTALGDRPYDSPWARRAVVVIDEIHHVGVAPAAELTGNMGAKRAEVLASLLGLLGHGTLKVGPDHRSWSAQQAMVFALGAFEGLLDTTRQPSVADLKRAGLPVELATRFHDVLLLRPLGEGSLANLLRRWPAFASLRRVCERLGYTVVVHPEAVTRAARAVMGGSESATPRTAGGWLVCALQDALLAALRDPAASVIEISPDSLRIPRASSRWGPDERSDGDAFDSQERIR